MAEQSIGLPGVPSTKKQVSGQVLMTSAQSDGAALGDSEGAGVAGVGIIVGEQAGLLPSGDGVNMGLFGEHSSGQQSHPIPVG